MQNDFTAEGFDEEIALNVGNAADAPSTTQLPELQALLDRQLPADIQAEVDKQLGEALQAELAQVDTQALGGHEQLQSTQEQEIRRSHR